MLLFSYRKGNCPGSYFFYPKIALGEKIATILFKIMKCNSKIFKGQRSP